MGSTDAFGLDDLEGIVRLRDELVTEFNLPYRPHVHADAVIGWAWSVFNDYDIEDNPLGFRRRTVRALAGATRRLQHLALADSIGIDFHKTGFAPYISSLFLVKDRGDFRLISREPELMPYLYQFGEYHPGTFTLEINNTNAAINQTVSLGPPRASSRTRSSVRTRQTGWSRSTRQIAPRTALASAVGSPVARTTASVKMSGRCMYGTYA